MEIIKFLQYTFYVFYWSYLIGNSSEGHKIDSVTNMRYEIQERNVIIEWDLPGNLQLKDEHYQVEYDYRKKFGFCPREGRTQSGDTIERKKIIHYLNYFSIYNIYVRIHNISTGGNEEEYGNWKLLTFETPPGELSHSELSGVDLKLVNYTRDTISFQIENLKCEQIHGSLIFKVVVEKKNPWCTNSVALSREIQLDKVNNLVFKFPLFMDPSEKYIYKGQLCRSSKCIPLSEGLLQINSTDNSTPTFPIMFNVTWNEENMMEIYWTYNHIEKMTGLKIFVQTVQSIPQYKEDNFNCKRIDDHCSACVIQNPLRINNTFQFPEKFLPSTRLIIEIFADDSHNVVRSRKLVTSSYPPFPALKDTMIRIEKLKNDTLDVTLNVAGINSKFDVTWCKLFILINDSTSEDTEVTRKIENSFNINLQDKNNFRIVAVIDLPSKLNLLKYTIGNGSTTIFHNISFYNRPLKEQKIYNITILLVNKFYNKYKHCFHSTTWNFKNTDVPHFPTRKEGRKNTNEDGAIFTFLWLFFILLVSICVGVFIGRNRLKTLAFMRSSFRKRILEETAIYSSKSFDLTEDLSYEDLEKLDEMSFKVTSKVENSQTNTVANTTTSIHSMRIEVSTFEEYVKRSIENGEFERQHALLPKGHLYPHNHGLLPENQPKNRYKNLYPYDHSRVKLKIAREEYSDYINANYINGYKVEKAYIATQGPKKNTIEDFWRMIWQEKVKFIVMLANLIENKQNSVDKYWPDGNKGILFDDIYVHHQSTEFFCDYEYRIFVLSCNNETRKVEQLHFTSWPDNRIPLYSHTLSSILKKMLKMNLSAEHPIVVHCSGGVGRTGTVILSDICLRMAGKEGAVDILNTLQKLRENRLNMVDNVEQYKLAHLVVLESLMGLSTSLACNHQLENNLRQLMNGKFRSEQDYLKQIEWQDEVMKSVAENSGNFMNYPEKNRIPEIIPEPQSRIILSKYPETDSSSSYINAIKIHGFGYQKRVIVTQQPLPHTLGDFWRLIVEQRTSIIVSLNEVDTQNQTSIHFWPTEAKPTLQPVDFLEVTFDRVINFDHYDIYTVNVLVRRGEEKTMDVDVFAFKRWPVKDPIPLNCEEFINFMEEVDSKISQNILVTCFDGVSASGVYVALSLLIYKMKIELICDICLAVRTARHDRKQFINDDRQFFFLYEAAIAFNKMCQGSAKLK